MPELELQSGCYRAAFARSTRELDQILRLRYEVFNLELGEGLDSNHESQRDLDPYDPQFHHLYVEDTRTEEIIGTYRMQTSAMAEAGLGFYSADEFRFDQLPANIVSNAVELGRACIAKEHRSGRVLFLLWRGMLQYLRFNRHRYLLGCCSLTSQNPAEAEALFRHLRKERLLWEDFCLETTPEYTCPQAPEAEIASAAVSIPRLMQMYLDYGARMCSEPAIDHDFKTVDYLALFDFEAQLSPKLSKIFADLPAQRWP